LKPPTAWLLCVLALAVGAPAPGASLSMEAVSGKGPLTTSPAPDSASGPPPSGAMPDPSKPVVDSSDLKLLPPRILPLKKQMMFAGAFMVFLALMLTSMQNFNPND
jgi:hypothetical protein